jgi:hypothetical protein
MESPEKLMNAGYMKELKVGRLHSSDDFLYRRESKGMDYGWNIMDNRCCRSEDLFVVWYDEQR